MEYRKLGRTGLEVSTIGLGTEHLVRHTESMEAVLRAACEAGVNYMDLVWTHAEFWDPFGPALRRYRDKFVLAVHWSYNDRFELEWAQRHFDDNLSRVGNEYAEIGMITMLDTEFTWNTWAPKSLECLQQYKEQGRIDFIGMSTHQIPMATRAARSGLFDVVMTPINIARHRCDEYQELYRACEEEGVGLVAMKVYRGGALCFTGDTTQTMTPVQCLHYVLSQPVSTTVPGAKTVTEYQATLQYLEASDAEKQYEGMFANVDQNLQGECVYCNHCLPCPQEIDIGRVNKMVDTGQYHPREEIMSEYALLPAKASDCIECGDCMTRCPYDVNVLDKMQKAVQMFEHEEGL